MADDIATLYPLVKPSPHLFHPEYPRGWVPTSAAAAGTDVGSDVGSIRGGAAYMPAPKRLLWIGASSNSENTRIQRDAGLIGINVVNVATWDECVRLLNEWGPHVLDETGSTFRIVTNMVEVGAVTSKYFEGINRVLMMRNHFHLRCPILIFCGSPDRVQGQEAILARQYQCVITADDHFTHRFATFGPIDGFAYAKFAMFPNFDNLSNRRGEERLEDSVACNRDALTRNVFDISTGPQLRKYFQERFHEILSPKPPGGADSSSPMAAAGGAPPYAIITSLPAPFTHWRVDRQQVSFKCDTQISRIVHHLEDHLRTAVDMRSGLLGKLSLKFIEFIHNPVLQRRFFARLDEVEQKSRSLESIGVAPSGGDASGISAGGGGIPPWNPAVRASQRDSEACMRLLSATPEARDLAADYPNARPTLMYHAVPQSDETLFRAFGPFRHLTSPTYDHRLGYSSVPRTVVVTRREAAIHFRVYLSWVIVGRPLLASSMADVTTRGVGGLVGGGGRGSSATASTPGDGVSPGGTSLADGGVYALLDQLGNPTATVPTADTAEYIGGDLFCPGDEARDVMPFCALDMTISV